MPCIVVKRGEVAQYEKLYKAFGDRMTVVWDRRRARARPAGSTEPDGDPQPEERRIRQPASWVALGFVVAEGAAK